MGPPPSDRRAPLPAERVVLAAGAAALLFALGVALGGARVARHDAELRAQADALRLALLRGHLALEEQLAGDRDPVVPAGARLDPAGRLTALAAAAAGDAELSVEVAALRGAVAAVSRAAVERRRDPAGSPPGSPAERAYDRALRAADERLAKIEGTLTLHGRRHRRAAAWLLGAAVAGWSGGVVVIAAALAAQRRRRERAEAALRDREGALAVAQRTQAVGQLAAGLAHDLNNALAGVRAHCELARDKAGEMPPERLRQRMDLVLASVLRASSLLERLLAFARRQPARAEAIDLNEVVRELARVLGGTLPPGVRLELDLASEPWPAKADLSSLEQVITNLFTNAADAVSLSGTIRLATANVPSAEGDCVCLAVSDDGPGIAAELAGRIFEPFVTNKERLGRSGLGLSVVRGLVDGLGGRVEVESARGRGATFRVLLPRGEPAEAEPAEAPAAPGEARDPLLLVDPDPAARAAIADLLASRGYRVTAVASASEALAAAAAEPFLAVLTDVQLGEASGPDLVDRLRLVRPGLRALYMSGYTDRIVLRRGAGRGEAFFLKKPFSGQGLARMLTELLAEPPAAAGATAAAAAGGAP